MTEIEAIEKTSGLPATVYSLTQDLKTLGVFEGGVLLVHSSLSSLGWVCGGPVDVIAALKQALGPNGTLVDFGVAWLRNHPRAPSPTPAE